MSTGSRFARIKILAVGKPKLAYARLGCEEYEQRLKAFAKVEVDFLKDSPDIGKQMLEKSKGLHRILLDEKGESLPSAKFAKRLLDWQISGVSGIAVLIGGAEGHPAELRQACDWGWSLGPATLQHELAMVVAMEQLYRALAINTGHPYHREGEREGR